MSFQGSEFKTRGFDLQGCYSKTIGRKKKKKKESTNPGAGNQCLLERGEKMEVGSF